MSDPGQPGPEADRPGRRIALASLAPATAAVLAGAAVLIGWHGVDLPAALYRVGLFHRAGLTLWDYAEARIMWRRTRLTAPGLVAGPAAVVLGRHNPAV